MNESPSDTRGSPTPASSATAPLLRRLGLFHATTAVIGGIVGAGIFLNPSVVARQVGSMGWILAAWILGGLVAMVGSWIYAELGSERPAAGGQYVFFREAYHPAVAFLYGWGLLWVIQSGGMAAVAITFAQYLRTVVGWGVDDRVMAVAALAVLSAMNCLGVRTGAATQSLLTVLKSVAIAGLVLAGFLGPAAAHPATAAGAVAAGPDAIPGGGLVPLLGAMVPVLFAYGGWQTAGFLAGEVRDPGRTLPRALILGIAGVIALYLGANAAYLRALGADGLAGTKTPASDVLRLALGESGARWIAIGIVVSTLGFLSQGMLTAPRVYYAMGHDRVFFTGLGRVDPRTGAPTAAILLQGGVAALIACSGSYEAILNYVVSVDFIFYGLAGVCIFVFRRRPESAPGFRVPGHPWTTLAFTAVCWIVVANLVRQQPLQSAIGLGILAAGLPAFGYWRRKTSE
ncbi:MAG: APC family permease [Verrucomicrobiota bacterium]|jgi:APA family basic amino acid/polyamine antiporter